MADRCAAQCIETQPSPSTVIAVAHVSNLATGRSARVEIDAVALSVIGLIESINAPGSAQKNAVLTAKRRQSLSHPLRRLSNPAFNGGNACPA